ncbi:MAG: GNAT family N-acetyltransferase [Candidatus Odinarchaeota archaeon]
MDLTIKPLSSDLLDDFLNFFDNIGFVDNPDWADCYCQFYHIEGSREKWAKRTKEQNRNSSKALITSGKMKGFLAYSNGKPIGWCNANSKENYSYLLYKDESNNEKKIAAVVCFLISPSYRNKGIARLLLKQVCEYYKSKKYDYIESYPVKNGKSDAHNYHGPYSLFLSEGFSVFKELKTIYVMRKNL